MKGLHDQVPLLTVRHRGVINLDYRYKIYIVLMYNLRGHGV